MRKTIPATPRRALTRRTLYAALLESARTTSMPADLKNLVSRMGLSPTMVVAAICAPIISLWLPGMMR